MQDHNGVSFDPNDLSTIRQMIQDGTQGTADGDGLVQGINMYGNVFEAARYYNSGTVNEDQLNDAEGATADYVVDVANRLTGWLYTTKPEC